MFQKGLNRDVPPIHIPQGFYRDARNIVFSKNYGAITNEDGFNELFTLPDTCNGVIPLNDDNAIFFIANETYDEIGLMSNGTYTRILRTTSSSDRFNFSREYPIKGRFRISNRGERIIVWNDNLNPTRILNIDNLPFDVDINKIPTTANSIETLGLFSTGNPPQITYSLDSGGFLLSGTYFITTSYTLVDGTELGYSTVAGPIKVNDETSGSFEYDGCPGGTATSSSILVNLAEVDQRYDSINIGVVSIIAGETSFYKVASIAILEGTSNYEYLYTGNEITESLLLEQITSSTAGLYNKAKATAVLNDKLVLGNLGAREHFDYQAYANDISITWAVDRQYLPSGNDSIKLVSNLNEDGFRAFEVYAFYIAFRYKDGGYSPAYHIPGREMVSGEDDPSALLTGAKKFQVEDTCSTDGTMSYWENANESYPDDFPDFANQKVRHHKFPSLNFIMDNASTLGFSDLGTRIGIDRMPVLTFNASNVVIPSELEDQIDGWQIFYAKRNINNMTCVGQGHLIFSHQAATNTTTFSPNSDIYNGLTNSVISKLIAVGLVENEDSMPAITKLSFHSPDLLLNKPSIAPTYVRNEIKLSISVADAHDGVNGNSDPIIQDTDELESDGTYYAYYTLLNFIDSGSTEVVASVTSSADLIRQVSAGSSLYVAPNTVNGNYFNIDSSEYISLNIEDGDTLTIASGMDIDSKATMHNLSRGSTLSLRTEDTYLSNLCQLVTTVYSPFVSQTLVAGTNVISSSDSDTTNATKIGDSYVSSYSFVATKFIDENEGNSDTEAHALANVAEGYKLIRNYVCECNINIKFRHESTTPNSKYYGKSDYKIDTRDELGDSFLSEWVASLPQDIQYNDDYSAQNTFNPVFPKNTNIDTLSSFPFRVIVSEKTSNELSDSGWRTFLPNNYKDIVSVKGEITNLEVWDDVLLIQVKNSLFRTIGAQKLKTSTEDVTIGTGLIFEHEPKEILTSEMGYLGNQNLIGCGVNKLGYTFFDADQGKLFIVGSDIKEISANGLRNYLRDNFTSDPVADNPLYTTGVSIAYDEKYNRLIACKKGTNSFTVSYSPEQNGFTSFHDYTPDYIFNTRTKVFSIKDNVVYEHNHTNKATFYGTVYPSYIEPVINTPERTVFDSLRWNSEVIDSNSTSLFHKTFTKILVYNSYQCSGEINLTSPTNIFNAETTWNFNNFYDIVKNRNLPFFDSNGLILSNLNTSLAWFKQRRFVDRWIATRLIYNNTDQNTLLLYDVSALMRKSAR